MHFFIIGASGYIGGAIANRVQSMGHSVSGLTRRPEAAQRLSQAGITAVNGSIQDIPLLTQHALSADCVIYAAIEFNPAGFEAEYQAIRALISVLKGTNKSLIFTSGLGVLGNSNQPMNEDSAYNPWPLVVRRVDTEQMLRTAADLQQVNATIIRPGMVYGGKKGNGLNLYVKGAIDLGLAPYLDKQENRWPVIHVDDLADLYVRVATKGGGKPSVVHALTAERVTLKLIAQTVAERFELNKGSVGWNAAQLEQVWGAEAEILGINQHIQRSRAIDLFDWHPHCLGILDEIKRLRS